MRHQKTIQFLLITATFLSLSLSGFTVYNYDNFVLEEETGFACGTCYVNSNALEAHSKDPIVLGGEVLFNANCKSCHRIDQKVIGPALRNVYAVRDSVWLRSWITNSSKMIAQGDPDAVKLFKDYKETQMTAFTSFSKEDMDKLLVYLKAVSEENR